MEKWIIGGICIFVIILMGAIQLIHNLKHPTHIKNSDKKQDSTNDQTRNV